MGASVYVIENPDTDTFEEYERTISEISVKDPEIEFSSCKRGDRISMQEEKQTGAKHSYLYQQICVDMKTKWVYVLMSILGKEPDVYFHNAALTFFDSFYIE